MKKIVISHKNLNRDGFTLVELIIAIVILVILVGVTIGGGGTYS